MDEQIADVLARVKFEYFRERLGVLQIEYTLRNKLWDEFAGAIPNMVEGSFPWLWM